MLDDPILKKLKHKQGDKILVINTPETFDFQGMHGPIVVNPSDPNRKADFLLIFAYHKAEVDRLIEDSFKFLKYDGLLWIAYPKGTSGIKTDINRDKGWESLKKLNLIVIAVVSLDNTWSAVRFRPIEVVKSSRKLN